MKISNVIVTYRVGEKIANQVNDKEIFRLLLVKELNKSHLKWPENLNGISIK